MNDAITKYQELVTRFPENELFRFSLGKALIEAGRDAEAKTHLQIGLAKKPDWMVVVMVLAQIARRENNLVEAKRLYEQALQLALTQQHEDPEKEIRAALAQL
jgi:predicted Zn-dependent protease